MIYKSSRSRIETYESGSDEVLEVWRLKSQSGTQEVLKKISNWMREIQKLGTR